MLNTPKPKLTWYKIKNHFKTIYRHRRWVKYYCRLANIPFRGLVHDLSKYLPIEFIESARYWTGTSSPINEAKKQQGYSLAWIHHRNHNRHHWAYWADNFSEGLIVYPMPKYDFVEMVCDFLAAGRTYYGINFSYQKELEWWNKDKEKGCRAMNIVNKKMLDIIFSDLAKSENPEQLIGLPRKNIPTPEQLIRTRYFQDIWDSNSC